MLLDQIVSSFYFPNNGTLPTGSACCHDIGIKSVNENYEAGRYGFNMASEGIYSPIILSGSSVDNVVNLISGGGGNIKTFFDITTNIETVDQLCADANRVEISFYNFVPPLAVQYSFSFYN